MDGVGPEQLRIKQLLTRVAESDVREIIMAPNPTVEGGGHRHVSVQAAEAFRRAGDPAGLWHSVGGDLEYADEVTLRRSLEGRSRIE